jgi:hypothetical protein
MRKGTIAALISAALVAGLALGTFGVASAASPAAASKGAGRGASLGAICRGAGGTIADIVAKLTAQPVADVYAARETGKSFAEIAAAKNVSADALTAEVLAARKTALDAAVKAGTVTKTQADTALANMKTNVSAKITSDAPSTCTGAGPGSGAGNGAGRGNGGGGRGMMGSGGCGGTCVTQP